MEMEQSELRIDEIKGDKPEKILQPSQQDEEPQLHWRTWACFGIAVFTYLTTIEAAVGSGIYALQVGEALNGLQHLLWLANSTAIVTAVLAPPIALMSDIHGRKWILIFGLGCGWIGCIVSATANSILIVIGGAVITGMGGAVQPLLGAIVSEIIPRRYRPLAQAATNTAAGIGTLLAIFAPGAIITYSGAKDPWRYIFVIPAILYFISFVGFIFLYSLMHHALFSRSRNFALGLFLLFIEGLIFSAFNVWTPQEIARVWESNTFLLGCRIAAYGAPIPLFTPLAGWLAFKFQEARYLTALGFALYLIGCIGMATATVGSKYASIGYEIIAGAGSGFPLMLMFTFIQLSVPPELLGLATALGAVMRGVGTAVGVSALGAIFYAKVDTKLIDNVAEAVIPLGLAPRYVGLLIEALQLNDIAALRGIPGFKPQMVPAALAAAKIAYSASFRNIWFLAIALSVCAIGLSLAIAPIRPMMTQHIDAPAEAISTMEADGE
ncbi:MAG: hypothetical protein CYPHOPRED_003982 [Cyphobasidiales sp. Tagirdzhanova-0007]|nr:MAG: hypothetical protein CYPHOPRED_003982 [Cyphobasidiales sp. Tagirdzhanova-0007]